MHFHFPICSLALPMLDFFFNCDIFLSSAQDEKYYLRSLGDDPRKVTTDCCVHVFTSVLKLCRTLPTSVINIPSLPTALHSRCCLSPVGFSLLCYGSVHLMCSCGHTMMSVEYDYAFAAKLDGRANTTAS